MARMKQRTGTNTGSRRESAGAAALPLLMAAVDDHRAGRLDAAEAGYERVLALQPRHPDALHLLGVVAHQRGEHARAVALIRRAVAINRNDPAFPCHLGAALLAQGRADDAILALRKALSLNSDHVDSLTNLGNAWMQKGKPEDAERCYRRAVALRPDAPAGHSNLGSALRAQGRLADAEACYETALHLRPAYPAALSNLGRVLHEQARYEEALARFDVALRLDSAYEDAHANRGVLLLTLGRFPEGWQDYAWRFAARGSGAAAATTPWDGSDPAGRSIRVRAEQGIGSAIHFVRYVPMLVERGARVVLECRRPLLRLFASLLPEGVRERVTLVAPGEGAAADFEVPLLSLPQLFGTDAASIPARIPYLAADPALTARWGERLDLPADSTRVGLVWSGNTAHENDRNRSMPAERFGPLLDVPGCAFLSLQIGARERDLERHARGRVRTLGAATPDFADTAAILQHLDVVVSVDTAVAHLAGALGRLCFLLVPYVPEWRWQLERSDSPWYPSLRLFRQTAPGDWAGVITRVAAALSDLPLRRAGAIP